MKIEYKFCRDCLNNKKGFCAASRNPDLVTGNEHRTCAFERLDGLGRCSSLGNNYHALPPKAAKKSA